MFFGELQSNEFWFDFAMTQLFIAGRVQEVAGLQKSSVDFSNRQILIKDVVVWDKKSKRFDYLKPEPKNGEVRVVHMNDILFQSLVRRVNDNPHSDFVFSNEGIPLSYRQIQFQYNNALKKCGLYEKYSGTHILRHSMATLTRLVTGSLEATQAITGHKDQRLVQHYAALDFSANQKAQVQIQSFLETEKFFTCEQV